MFKVKVKYVGRKQFCLDNVAKSGATWDGPGTEASVTPLQAKVLISYPDQWALSDEKDAKHLAKANYIATEGEDGKVTKTKLSELTGPVEKMTAAQLVAYAMATYGKVLKANRPRKIMLDEVVAMASQFDRL